MNDYRGTVTDCHEDKADDPFPRVREAVRRDGLLNGFGSLVHWG